MMKAFGIMWGVRCSLYTLKQNAKIGHLAFQRIRILKAFMLASARRGILTPREAMF